MSYERSAVAVMSYEWFTTTIQSLKTQNSELRTQNSIKVQIKK
jgi:hypothetical protein